MSDTTLNPTNKPTWQLGSVSAHYEANGLNPGTISTGRGDHGGMSYGVYQLSSKTGTVTEYLNQSTYGPTFDGLEPATTPFNNKWHETANSNANFGPDQRDFIARTHFQPQVDALKADGVDLSQRGIAVQEALWSTSVQYRHMTKGVFEGALQEKFGPDYKNHLDKISDKDFVSAVQDYKLEHVDQNFRSSTIRERDHIRDRIPREKQDLIDLAEGRTPDYSHASRHSASSHPSAETRKVQSALNTLGYTDSRGRPIAVDGIEGHATRSAITAFQHDNNLTPDGIAGPRTQAALNAWLKETQAPAAAASSHPVPSPSQTMTPPQLTPSSTTATADQSYWHAQVMAGRAMAQTQAQTTNVSTMPKTATPQGY